MHFLEKASPQTKIDRFARQIHTIAECALVGLDKDDVTQIRHLAENILDQCKTLEYMHNWKNEE